MFVPALNPALRVPVAWGVESRTITAITAKITPNVIKALSI